VNPEELTRKWQHVLDATNHVWSWTEPHTLAYCCERASHASNAVELGTYLGKSAFVMLQANPNLHLWCVDTFLVPGTQYTASYFLDKFIKEGRCELILGDSARAAGMLQHMKGRLDFVFADDGHAEEDLRRDIGSFLPLMRSGTYLFGHDWDGDNDVARGVKSMLPVAKIEIPVPRVWQYRVQKCCGE